MHLLNIEKEDCTDKEGTGLAHKKLKFNNHFGTRADLGGKQTNIFQFYKALLTSAFEFCFLGL